MKLFNNQNAATFVCTIVIFSSMVTSIHMAKADKNSITSAIKPTAKETAKVKVEGNFRLLLSDESVSTHSKGIICRVTLKNVSDENLYFSDSYPLSDYKFTVKDEGGKTVPLTQFGQNYQVPNFFRIVRSSLTPNKAISFDFPVNRIYDMTKTGTYSLSVSREVLKDIGNKKFKG